jgi:starvation-inducible DNA-binding protein
MKINTGLNEQDRKNAAASLSKLLADSYTLYLKTQYFHWNVTGPMFQSLHLLFEQQYTELALAVDTIAERIRALGFPAPGSYTQFSQLTTLKEATAVPPAIQMIEQLVSDQETVIHTARAAFQQLEGTHDEATIDLLNQRLQVHEKNAWMLRSHLD